LLELLIGDIANSEKQKEALVNVGSGNQLLILLSGKTSKVNKSKHIALFT